MAVTPYRFFTTVTPIGGNNPWTNPDDSLTDTGTSADNDANVTVQGLRYTGQDLSADVPKSATIDEIELSVWCRCLDFGGVSSAADIFYRIGGNTSISFPMPEQTAVYLNMQRTLAQWGLTQEQARDFVDGGSYVDMVGITRINPATDRYSLYEHRVAIHYTPQPASEVVAAPALF
jgi:hypothetical protein